MPHALLADLPRTAAGLATASGSCAREPGLVPLSACGSASGRQLTCAARRPYELLTGTPIAPHWSSARRRSPCLERLSLAPLALPFVRPLAHNTGRLGGLPQPSARSSECLAALVAPWRLLMRLGPWPGIGLRDGGPHSFVRSSTGFGTASSFGPRLQRACSPPLVRSGSSLSSGLTVASSAAPLPAQDSPPLRGVSASARPFTASLGTGGGGRAPLNGSSPVRLDDAGSRPRGRSGALWPPPVMSGQPSTCCASSQGGSVGPPLLHLWPA